MRDTSKYYSRQGCGVALGRRSDARRPIVGPAVLRVPVAGRVLTIVGAGLLTIGMLSVSARAEPSHGGGVSDSSLEVRAPNASAPAVIDGWFADTTSSSHQGVDRRPEDGDIDALLDAAIAAQMRGDVDLAQRLFERVIATDSSSPAAAQARRQLGAIYRGEVAGTATGTGEPPAEQSPHSARWSGTSPSVTVSPLPEVGGASAPDSPAGSAVPVAEGNVDGVQPADLDTGSLQRGVQHDAHEAALASPAARSDGLGLVTPQPWRPRARRSHRFEQLMRTDIGDRIFFAMGSTQIGGRARGVLERQAEWLARYPDLYVVVEGHADDPGGDGPNDAIARARAEAARALLIRAGMRPERVDIDVRGRKDPVATCESTDCRSQNRRAVIRIMIVLPAAPGDHSSPKQGLGDVPDGPVVDAEGLQPSGHPSSRR